VVKIVHYSHNSGCCRSVAPWITVLSLHTGGCWFTNLLCCDIPRNKVPITGPCHIWRIYTQCLFSGHEKNTVDSWVAMVISLASAGYGSSRVVQHLFRPNLVFQPIWGWGDLGSCQLLQSNFSPEGDEKFLQKTTATQTVANCLCWCVEPHFFSHLLLDLQKDGYLCSFLEVVPRLVIRHLLQPVLRLLLRLAVVVIFLLLLLQNLLQNH